MLVPVCVVQAVVKVKVTYRPPPGASGVGAGTAGGNQLCFSPLSSQNTAGEPPLSTNVFNA